MRGFNMDFTKEFEIYDLLVKNQTDEIKQEDKIDDNHKIYLKDIFNNYLKDVFNNGYNGIK